LEYGRETWHYNDSFAESLEKEYDDKNNNIKKIELLEHLMKILPVEM
jgi:hypothetical protein